MAAALALAACADGSDGAQGPTTTVATTATVPSTSVPTFTGDADSAFCTLLAEVDLGTLTADGGGDGSIQGAFAQLIDVFLEAEVVAPPEIKADITLLGEGVFLLDQALFEVGYDFDQLPDEVVRAVNDPDFADAGARLAAYRTQVCDL
ncbi:MAG: hypothetical protein ABL966_07160 [Acidimicrobiales bacterium]